MAIMNVATAPRRRSGRDTHNPARRRRARLGMSPPVSAQPPTVAGLLLAAAGDHEAAPGADAVEAVLAGITASPMREGRAVPAWPDPSPSSVHAHRSAAAAGWAVTWP